VSDLFDRAAKFFHELQTEICNAVAEADGAREFGADAWQKKPA
jgi:coproporphyrinogen III oxidase